MVIPVFPWPRDLDGTTRSRFQLVTRSVFSVSPYTARRRVQGPLVMFWTAEMTHPKRDSAEWRTLEGFVAQLDGVAGQVRLYDPLRTHPRGLAAGVNQAAIDAGGTGDAFDDGFRFDDGFGFLDGGSVGLAGADALRGATELKISGLVASTANSLLPGDLFEVGGYLYEVLSAAATDAAGETLARIRPGLRTNVLANDAVKFAYPSSPFSLANDDGFTIERDLMDHADIGLSFVEVVP